ncbi:MAG TPA: Wadjet anti-phage system protein JetD domain-containing protein [Steroidobacteraceae bacterium]|nr:Wadjet anti-phage system protein JetD domain-containing protein [Steroidobacteraceae bacterium]
MNWRSDAARLALLELLVRGSLKRRRAQVSAWDALDELPWTRRTGRRDEVGLVEVWRHELVALLDRVWPEWGEVLAALTARGLAPTPDGWSALGDAQRAEELPQLPGQLNRRTAAALVAPHSKASLTDRRLAALGDAEATHDGSVRLRPPRELFALTPQGRVDLTAVASVLGEVSIPERAITAGFKFEGTIRAVLLVENLGAFCDLRAVDGWLLVHVAGWDTATVAGLLKCLAHVPVILFGDLDPNGVRILRHLRALRSDMLWFVPEFWTEFIEAKGLPGAWPADLDLGEAPSLVRQLASRGLWLEQEPVVVDPRTSSALAALLGH